MVPKARGGKDAIWNIVAACRACNEKKADSWPTCDCEFCRATIARHFMLVLYAPDNKK